MTAPRMNPTLAAARTPKDTRSEKQVEAMGDAVMETMGFWPIRFSQPRATMQTPGWPDRLYIDPTRKLAVLWEAKAVGGTQSHHQLAMQRLVESVGWSYVVGTDDVLVQWLVDHRLAERLPNGLRKL